MDTALYFPYIRVPQSVWFTQVLLYWDDAASIIPTRIQDDQQELGAYTSELMREGLLRSVMPERSPYNARNCPDSWARYWFNCCSHKPCPGWGR